MSDELDLFPTELPDLGAIDDTCVFVGQRPADVPPLAKTAAGPAFKKYCLTGPFSAAMAAATGGYPQNTVVVSSSGSSLWVSTVDSNTTDPDSDEAAGWRQLVPIPEGGTEGQVVGKTGGADFEIGWVDQAGGGGTITLNGAVSGASDTGTITTTFGNFSARTVLANPTGANAAPVPTALNTISLSSLAVPTAALPMGGQKITGGANGAAPTDFATVGQIPAALPPNGAAGGVLSGSFPAPGFADSVFLPGTPTATTPSTGDNSDAIATIAFVVNLATGLWSDQGNWDASGNAFPTLNAAGGAIKKGNIWTISVPGILGGEAVVIGDTIRAIVDTPGQTAANWAQGETNLGYTPLSSTNATNHAVLLGTSGANVTAVTLSSGQLLIGATGADPTARTVSGDATLGATGVLTLATVNSAPGALGDGAHVVTLTVNAKGLITAAAATAIAIAAGSVSGLAAVATSGSASDLSAGTLGAARGGAGAISGLMKANGAGVVSAATAGTDYVIPSALSAYAQLAGTTNFSTQQGSTVAYGTTNAATVALNLGALSSSTGITWSGTPPASSNKVVITVGTAVTSFTLSGGVDGRGGSIDIVGGSAAPACVPPSGSNTDYGTPGSPTLNVASGKINILSYDYLGSIGSGFFTFGVRLG